MTLNVAWNSQNSGVTLSNNNLTVKVSSSTSSTTANYGKTIGKWYWEMTVGTLTGTAVIGIANITNGSRIFNSTGHMGYTSTGVKYNGTSTTYGTTFKANDIISVLLDLDNGTLEYWKNGIGQGVAFTTVKGLGTVYPSFTSMNASDVTATANFGATPFAYKAPSGYKAYNYEPANKILISSNDGYYHVPVISDETKDAVPTMTSLTTPSGIVSVSSTTGSNFAWRVFDDSISSAGWISGQYNIKNQWITYEFPIKKRIGKYTLTVTYTPSTSPKDWRFEGSNDGTTWTVLDERIDITDWTTGVQKSFYVDTLRIVPYKIYRLYILNNNGSTSYVSIDEMEMMEVFAEDYHLETNTEQNFIKYGIHRGKEIDFTKAMKNKVFIKQSSEVIGNGKVYKKTIDTIATPIKRVGIEYD